VWGGEEVLEPIPHRYLGTTVFYILLTKRIVLVWAWWYKAVIPAVGRLRQEDHEFKDSHMETLSQKKKKQI
jgi:hypothetical protein